MGAETSEAAATVRATSEITAGFCKAGHLGCKIIGKDTVEGAHHGRPMLVAGNAPGASPVTDTIRGR